jgi:predicted RNA-binding protein with PIN domain
MRHLLVDGHNVLLRRADTPAFGPEEHRARRERLVAAVRAYGRRHGYAGRVAFDGITNALSPWNATRVGGVQVRYSPASVDADRILLEWVRELEGKDVTLVTSDRELAARAKSLGAKILAAETLVESEAPTRAPGGRGASPPDARPPQPRLSRAEVDYWVRVFSKPPAPNPNPSERGSPAYADPYAALPPEVRARSKRRPAPPPTPKPPTPAPPPSAKRARRRPSA